MTERRHLQEAAMEEILASIERMISDKQSEPEPTRDSEQPATEESTDRDEGTQGDDMADENRRFSAENSIFSENRSVFGTPMSGSEESAGAGTTEESGPTMLSRRHPEVGAESGANISETVEEQIHRRIRRPEPLLSEHAEAAIAGAFDELATSAPTRDDRSVDELVKDLMRPLLRDWLDEHLPTLVERMVKEEIERIARLGR